jgi:nucleotide-binding universal stress UspA family protein
MEEFKNILVVVKSTKDCGKALHHGILLARSFQAKLYVMNLMHDPFGLEHWQLALPSLKAIKEEYATMQVKAKTDLDRMISAEKAKGLPIEVEVAKKDPLKEIERSVENHAIDLLIMTAHAEGHLEQMLFGRLNEEIHRRLPCTTMFVKKEPSRVKESLCLKGDRVQPCET